MGYYTEYQLEVIDGDTDLIEEFRDYSEESRYALNRKGGTEEASKWYEYKDEMNSFSKKHPQAVFKLSGKGEEVGDIWVHYFKNGRSQRCNAIISFDEFDEGSLI